MKGFGCFSLRVDHPFRILRALLKKDPELREFATQRRFAELLDVSLALVKAVEGGKAKVSRRLAKTIERVMGVDSSWYENFQPEGEIPSVTGQPLTVSMVRKRIEKEIQRNERIFEKAVNNAAGASGSGESSSEEKLASMLADSIRAAAVDALKSRGVDVFPALFQIVEESKARIREEGAKAVQAS